MAKIREVRKNEFEGQYRFKIIVGDKTSRLVADFVPPAFSTYRPEMINFEVKNSRVIQLGKDILNYFNRKAKLEAFEATVDELEKKLEERYGVEHYVINLIRLRSHFDQKEAARRIYEWLKSNEEWLYRDD